MADCAGFKRDTNRINGRQGEFYTMAGVKVRGKGTFVQLDKSVPRSRCRKWELRVSVGRDLATGRYPPRTRKFNGTPSEANRALREFIAEIERGDAQRRSDMDFGEYADAWLEERRESCAHGTWLKNCSQMKCAKMHLSKARLDEIRPQTLEKTYKALLDGHSPSGRPLSGTYVNSIHVTLHRMFRQAVKDGHMASNPCDFADAPSLDTVERKAMRRDGIVALVEKLSPEDPIQFAVRLMVKTGIRRGEAHGLSVGDVDRDAMVLHIRHSYDDGGNLKEPKTKAGIRDLPLTESALADIDARIADIERRYRNTRKRLKTDGPVLGPETPLVGDGLGNRMLPHSSTRWWTRERKGLGLEGWTLHELRHSYITELARRKVDPKVLQTIAGHAKFSTTMDIYNHVDMEDKKNALKVVDW